MANTPISTANPLIPTGSLGAVATQTTNGTTSPQPPTPVNPMLTQSTPILGNTGGTSISPVGTSTAPAVHTATPATELVNSAQTNVNDKLAGGAAISAAKSNLVTSYDEYGNMVQTGGLLPNGTQYKYVTPKGTSGYIPNPTDVAKQQQQQQQNLQNQQNQNLIKALTPNEIAAQASQTTPTTNSTNTLDQGTNLTYNNPSSVTPPQGIDYTTQDGQATWYNQDPKGFATWAKDQGISSDNQFQVKVLAGNQQLQSLQTQGTNLLNQYLTGTFPLTASQQAQVAGLQQMWEGTINAQRSANDTYIGASATASARAGGQYDPMGSLASAQRAIQTGLDRVAVFQGQEVKAVNDLIQSFQDKDYKAASDNLVLQERLTKDITDNLKTVNDSIVKAKEDAQTQQNRIEDKQYQQVTKPINDLATDAAKNGAPKDIQDKISATDNVQDAIAAAGDWLQAGTGTLGDYIQYKRDAEGKGLVPMSYIDYKDEQDKKAEQTKIREIYAQAAATASANATESDKVQQKLEREYSTDLKVLFSSRTGALGIENLKIDQANHLNALLEQDYDPKTGNYNVPIAQYSELVMGLANLISNTGTVTEGARDSINAATASGDINKALQYATGQPQNGNTQAIIKNMVASIDRQAQQAIQNRQPYFQQLSDRASSDLDPTRKAHVDQTFSDAIQYSGQNRIDTGTINNYLAMAGHTLLPTPITTPDGKVINNTGDLVVELLAQPGATDSNVLKYMQDNGYITNFSVGATTSTDNSNINGAEGGLPGGLLGLFKR